MRFKLMKNPTLHSSSSYTSSTCIISVLRFILVAIIEANNQNPKRSILIEKLKRGKRKKIRIPYVCTYIRTHHTRTPIIVVKRVKLDVRTH